MSTTPSEKAPPAQVNYVRGQVGGEVDARRVLRGVAALCVAVLVVLVVVTTVGAAHQNSTQSELQRDGIPVKITVTSCAGVSSGIGQSLVYYSCQGSYVVDGHRYNEEIGGNRADHAVGQTLAAVAVRSDPSVVSTASAVAKKFSRWTPYITPVVLAVVTVAFVALLGWLSRRRPRTAQDVGALATHPSPP